MPQGLSFHYHPVPSTINYQPAHEQLIKCVRMRVVDGSVIGLIRQWLAVPVVEAAQEGQPPSVNRRDQGPPRGGVLTPRKQWITWRFPVWVLAALVAHPTTVTSIARTAALFPTQTHT
jgi:hypothetical protein